MFCTNFIILLYKHHVLYQHHYVLYKLHVLYKYHYVLYKLHYIHHSIWKKNKLSKIPRWNKQLTSQKYKLHHGLHQNKHSFQPSRWSIHESNNAQYCATLPRIHQWPSLCLPVITKHLPSGPFMSPTTHSTVPSALPVYINDLPYVCRSAQSIRFAESC